MSSDAGEVATQVVSNMLLFMLLGGMAASVDTDCLRDSFRRWRGIAVGLLCQFIILPIVGLFSVKVFQLKTAFGIALLATTASPGGAYSNWWCSLMNADLALSIAMTTCSTAASVILMPANIMLYTTIAYGENPELEIWRILLSIGIAVCAILTGTLVSAMRPAWRKRANVVGNVAGLALIIFGLFVSSTDEPLWDKEAEFYPAVALPCIAGLLLSFLLSCVVIKSGNMVKPEGVSVCVEVCYQNTGLALSIALASFDGHERGDASAVPLFYAVCQVICLPTFLLIAWQAGWTYAPSSIHIHRAVIGNFQPLSSVEKARSISNDICSTDPVSANYSPAENAKQVADMRQDPVPNVVPSPSTSDRLGNDTEQEEAGLQSNNEESPCLRQTSRCSRERAPGDFDEEADPSVEELPASEGRPMENTPSSPLKEFPVSPKVIDVPNSVLAPGLGCCGTLCVSSQAGTTGTVIAAADEQRPSLS